MLKKTLVQLCALAAMASAATGANAQPATELTFATAAPVGSPWQKQYDRFAADVATETKGSVKINVFYGSQLGAENDVIAQVARGRVDMGAFTLGSIGLQVPEALAVSLPMYFDTEAQRGCVLDKHAFEPVSAALAKKNLTLLSWLEVGSQQLSAKKPLLTPGDVKGLKVGVVINKLSAGFWEAVGAVPVATAVPEAASGMSTGLIDVYPSVAAFYVPSGINKVAPVWSVVNVLMSPGAMIIGKSATAKLSPDQLAGLQRAVAKTPASQIRSEIFAAEAGLIAKHKEGGGTVAEPTDEQRGEWKRLAAPFWAKAISDLGPAAGEIFAKVEEGKKSCGK